MIVGIDAYHEKRKQGTSVIGFVASMDKTFTEWYSVADVQKSTYQENSSTNQFIFHKILNKFFEVGFLFNCDKYKI